MAPPRRQASKKADAVNKHIAQQTLAGSNEDAEFEPDDEGMQMTDSMSVDSSPLSLKSRTPTPGSGLDTGLGLVIRQEMAEKGRPTLVQQVAKLNNSGLNVGEMIKFGRALEKVEGPASGNRQMDRTPNLTKAKEKQPQNTTSKKQKASKVNDGLLPSNSPPHRALSALKRPMSAYLENSPDNGHREREHKRPAQRRWEVPQPSGPIRMPLNKLPAFPPHFQESNPKFYNDADDIMKLYRMIHKHCDLSHLRALEIRDTNDPEYLQLPGFPGLPAYGRVVEVSKEPDTDGLSANERRMQVYNTQTQRGIQLTEDEKEDYRLRSKLVTILGNQRLKFEEMRQTPKPDESFDPHVHCEVDLSILALTKLKLATKKKSDPPLFANGTWYSSKRMEDEDSLGCTFCMFDCDYGISDERVWLPAEASGGFCKDCHEKTQTSVDEWLLSIRTSPEEFKFDLEKHARINNLCEKAANPPLKELGDDVGFKMQAMQMKQQNSNQRRQIALGSLGGILNAQLPGHQVMSASNGLEGQTSPENRDRVADAQKYQQQVISAFDGTSGGHIPPIMPRYPVTNGMAIEEQQQAVSKSARTGIPGQTPMITAGKTTAQQRDVKNTAGQTSKKVKLASSVQKQQKMLGMADQPSMTGACASTARQQHQPAANMAGKSSSKEIGVTREQNQAVVSGPGRKRSTTKTDTTQAMTTLVDNLSQDRQHLMKQHLINSAQSQIQRLVSSSMPSSPALSPRVMDDANSAPTPQQMEVLVDGHPRSTSSTGLPQQSPIMGRGMNNHRRFSDGYMSSFPAFSPALSRNGNAASDVQRTGAITHSHQRRTSYTGLPPPNPQTRVNFMGAGAGGDFMNHHRRTSSGTLSMPSSPMNADVDGFPNIHHRHLFSGSLPLSSPPMATENIFPNTQQNAWSGPGSSSGMQPLAPNGGMPGNNYTSHHRRTSSSSMVLSSPTTMLPPYSPTMDNGCGFSSAQNNDHQFNRSSLSPPVQSFLGNGMPGNNERSHHRRNSSGSMFLSSPTMRATANRFPNAQQYGSVSNGPGESAVAHPLLADFQMPMNHNQRRRVSNGNMMASSPMIMAYGIETANIQQGQAVTRSSERPRMQSATLNGAIPVNSAQQRRLSNGTTRRDILPMMHTGDGMPNGPKSRATNPPGDPGRMTATLRSRNNAGIPPTESTVVNHSNIRHPLNRANLPVQVIQLSRSGGIIGPTTFPPVQTISSNATEEAARAPRKAKKLSVPRNSLDPRSIRSFDGTSDSPPKQNKARTHRPGSSLASASVLVNGPGITEGPRMTEDARFVSPLRNGTAISILPKQANAGRPANTAGALPTPRMSPEAHSSTSMPNKPTGPFVPPAIPSDFAIPDRIIEPVLHPSHSPASTVSDFSMSPFPPFQDPTSMTPNLAIVPLIPGYEAHAHRHTPTLGHSGSSPLPSPGIMGPPPLPAALRRTVSQPTTPQFQPVAFCRGCPWRQIDVKKARICEACKARKLEIIKHKHVYFSSLHENCGLDGGGDGIGWGMLSNTQRRTCMVCPSLAAGQCRDCPLRLCSDCQVMMKEMGKNSITNLIQQFSLSRAHLRNDAFLLRGDGHGY